MNFRSNDLALRVAGVAFAALLLVMFSGSTASSQGLLESLFGAFQIPSSRAPLPAPAPAPSAPTAIVPSAVPVSESRLVREVAGPFVAYCVRLCDGRYFPLSRSNSISPADQCRSLCPTARTKVFGGSNISSATAADGSRYGGLDTAFLYRTRVVDHCTCNGRDAFGMARMNLATDPTLRPGDIVAMDGGFAAYVAPKAVQAGGEFTPISQSSKVSSELRRKLSDTKVLPARQADAQSAAPSRYRLPPREDRSAQLTR